MTDVTLGAARNSKRMAFLHDRRRVETSGLAGELVVPEQWLREIAPDALRRQFARTPYAVSFRAGTETFIVMTLQVTYGANAAKRVPELRGIGRRMARLGRPYQRLVAKSDRPG
jgi:hypothetical protein